MFNLKINIMKRFLSLIFVLVFCFNVKAQTSLTEAVDFYSVDEYDTEVHLFDILDHGQFALLYFFFSDAESSPVFDPCIADAFYHFGANQDEVYFIGVAPSDDSLSIDGWKTKYEMDFSVIHWFTYGSRAQDICEDYGVQIFSTLVLIAPDRKILIDNIWPITSSDALIEEIEAAMQPYLGVNEIENNAFNIYPNPASSEVKIISEFNGESDVNIYDMTGRCVKNLRVSDISNATVNISDLNRGVYFMNVNGRVQKLVVE